MDVLPSRHLSSLSCHSHGCVGHFEPLGHRLPGYCSVRQHRHHDALSLVSHSEHAAQWRCRLGTTRVHPFLSGLAQTCKDISGTSCRQQSQVTSLTGIRAFVVAAPNAISSPAVVAQSATCIAVFAYWSLPLSTNGLLPGPDMFGCGDSLCGMFCTKLGR
jgi:hypothetical protein